MKLLQTESLPQSLHNTKVKVKYSSNQSTVPTLRTRVISHVCACALLHGSLSDTYCRYMKLSLLNYHQKMINLLGQTDWSGKAFAKAANMRPKSYRLVQLASFRGIMRTTLQMGQNEMDAASTKNCACV